MNNPDDIAETLRTKNLMEICELVEEHARIIHEQADNIEQLSVIIVELSGGLTSGTNN